MIKYFNAKCTDLEISTEIFIYLFSDPVAQSMKKKFLCFIYSVYISVDVCHINA
jgi:hypothetical protein